MAMQLPIGHRSKSWCVRQSYSASYSTQLAADVWNSRHGTCAGVVISSKNGLAGRRGICCSSSSGQSQSTADDDSAGASWLRERRQVSSSSTGRGNNRSDRDRGGRGRQGRRGLDNEGNSSSSSSRGRGGSSSSGRGGRGSSNRGGRGGRAGRDDYRVTERSAAQQQQQQQQQQRRSDGLTDGYNNVEERAYTSRVQSEEAAEGFGTPSRSWGYRSGLIRYPDSNPEGADPGSSSSRGGGSSSRGRGSRQAAAAAAAANTAGDFVVIAKSGSGSYVPTTSELESKEGGSFWEAALGPEEDEYEDEDEFEDEDEGEDEVGIEEVANLMRELAEGLDDDESASTAEAAWRSYYISKQAPPPQLGPVRIKESAAGMGRGIFTTAAIAAGDLLMVASPLSLLYCEEGATPENEELAAALAAAVQATQISSSSSSGLALWQQRALLQLRPAGDAAADENLGQLPDLVQLLGDPADVAAAPDHSSKVAGSSSSNLNQQQQQQQLPSSTVLPTADEVLQLVHANCTGEEFEDSALVLLRGSTSCGHLGIWPAAAMINHSCAPNAHALLVGDKLVVRAAEAIAAGQQVTLGYLGPQLFAPASIRQQELKQQWGFDCTCARCKAEARYAGSSSGGSSSGGSSSGGSSSGGSSSGGSSSGGSSSGGSSSSSSGGSSSSSSSSSSGGRSSSSSSGASLAKLLLQAYHACQEMSEKLDAAIESDDLGAVAEMQQQMQQMQQQVEAGIRAAKPPANVRRWLQASVYDLYDLLSLCADQVPSTPPKRGKHSAAAAAIETEALATCARVVASVSPGSSAHADLTTEYMVRSEAKFGGEHQEAVDALRMCISAHTARFGPMGDGMLQLLMDTRAGAALL